MAFVVFSGCGLTDVTYKDVPKEYVDSIVLTADSYEDMTKRLSKAMELPVVDVLRGEEDGTYVAMIGPALPEIASKSLIPVIENPRNPIPWIGGGIAGLMTLSAALSGFRGRKTRKKEPTKKKTTKKS